MRRPSRRPGSRRGWVRGRPRPLLRRSMVENLMTPLASRIDLSQCAPAQLWATLDPEVRLAAARALYTHDWGESPTRREADFSIMQGMRFRESAVRQLSIDKRAHYLARSIRPTDSLAGSMLLALHLEHRRSMLGAFLDALEIPHADGLIDEDHDMKPPAAASLLSAASA